jgi:hypothetical protein
MSYDRHRPQKSDTDIIILYIPLFVQRETSFRRGRGENVRKKNKCVNKDLEKNDFKLRI